MRNQILTNTVGLINHMSIPNVALIKQIPTPNVGLLNHTRTRCSGMNQTPTLRELDVKKGTGYFLAQKSSLSLFFMSPFFKLFLLLTKL